MGLLKKILDIVKPGGQVNKLEETNSNSFLVKLEGFRPYQITKNELQKRIKNNFVNQLNYIISQLASVGNTKSYEDVSVAIEFYIKSIALMRYVKYIHNIDYNNRDLAHHVDRIRILSNKLKKQELGISCLTWYKNSECWLIGFQNSPTLHNKFETSLNKYENSHILKSFDNILDTYKSWIDSQMMEIENESFIEEKVKHGNFHLGSDCRKNNCKICSKFDGIDADDYPLLEDIQPSTPMYECELKNEDDESLCDCWIDRKIFRIDLKKQIELLEKEEAGLLNCKHEEGKEYVCKHCGLLMK